jgi:hypothetical protein
MQRTSTISTTASVALSGLAAGLVLSVAVIQPFRPSAIGLPQPEVPKIQACGAEAMDWSISKAGSCSLSTTGRVAKVSRDAISRSVVAANGLVDDASDLANGVATNALAEVDQTLVNAHQAIQQAVTGVARTAGAATQTAGVVVSSSISQVNGTIEGATHAAVSVADGTVETIGDVLDEAVDEVGETVDDVEDTVSDVDGAVDCVLSLGLMTLSGNQVVGCTS